MKKKYVPEKKHVTIKTITPLFIKGKEPNYGDGMIRGDDDRVYMIDQEMLFEQLEEKQLIDQYCAYYHRDKHHNAYEGYAKLFGLDLEDFVHNCQVEKGHKININRTKYIAEIKERVNVTQKKKFCEKIFFEKYENHELSFFLDFYGCGELRKNPKQIAKGIIPLSNSNKNEARFIRNVDGEYYIPGSSIKGAIRNALFWSLLKSQDKWLNRMVNYGIQCDQVNSDKPNFANVTFNDETIGKKSGMERRYDAIPDIKPEYAKRWEGVDDQLRDVFKAIKVSDSVPIGKDGDYTVTVITVCKTEEEELYRKSYKTKLYALPQDTNASFTIELDSSLLKRMYGENSVPPPLQSIDQMLDAVTRFYKEIYSFENKFFLNVKQYSGPSYNNQKQKYEKGAITSGFYNVSRDNLNLFRLGWGGGLMTKTQFLLLANGTRKKIRDDYTGKRVCKGPLAPKSRCLINDGPLAGYPLGWCELVYEKRKLQPGEVVSATLAEYKTVMVQDRKRFRPVSVTIEEADVPIEITCSKTAKKEKELQRLVKQVKVIEVDEEGQVVRVQSVE